MWWGKHSTLEQLKEVAVSCKEKKCRENFYTTLKQCGQQDEIRNEMTLGMPCNRVFEGVDLLLFDFKIKET